jgi:hypothetical protein
MPYSIRKLPNSSLYRVRNIDTGEIKAKATTMKNAIRQIRYLHMIDHKSKNK